MTGAIPSRMLITPETGFPRPWPAVSPRPGGPGPAGPGPARPASGWARAMSATWRCPGPPDPATSPTWSRSRRPVAPAAPPEPPGGRPGPLPDADRGSALGALQCRRCPVEPGQRSIMDCAPTPQTRTTTSPLERDPHSQLTLPPRQPRRLPPTDMNRLLEVPRAVRRREPRPAESSTQTRIPRQLSCQARQEDRDPRPAARLAPCNHSRATHQRPPISRTWPRSLCSRHSSAPRTDHTIPLHQAAMTHHQRQTPDERRNRSPTSARSARHCPHAPHLAGRS